VPSGIIDDELLIKLIYFHARPCHYFDTSVPFAFGASSEASCLN
jgi:hypothetical protein